MFNRIQEKRDTRHTLTCDVSRIPSIDTLYHMKLAKAYKIGVRPINDAVKPYTVIGFVTVSNSGERTAIDVFGRKHDICDAKRLREKHVRETFGIDERFDVKQVCIQVDAQMQSEKPKRAPHIPNTPTLRRPKVA